MIGAAGEHADIYLTIVGGLVVLAFGLPMALWPLRWAAVLRWRLPEETDLAVYFGRCLGSVASIIGVFSIVAANTPAVQPFWCAFLVAGGGVMVLVHLYGAWRGIQPITETIEIIFWAALVALTLLFMPGNPYG